MSNGATTPPVIVAPQPPVQPNPPNVIQFLEKTGREILSCQIKDIVILCQQRSL